ncbi:MAG: DsbA family oxidoreductase [Flavipsychrobacter sp.]|nr:DsbA family oxidoreductase [Flavipsychrobacter sp.]
MKVEIWSDVMCPFCYIGKRKFEQALVEFAHRDEVLVTWKSFQLAPDMQTEQDKTIDQYLAEHKGIPLAQAREMNAHVTQLAKKVGLTYNFDKAVVANSFDAHRFSHLAKQHGLQDIAEERLFAAYFTEGKNTADHDTLIQLGTDIGLDATETRNMLNSNLFAEEVRGDIREAQQIGASGVPFFVFVHKYAISGAQDSSTFLQALNQVWEETGHDALPLAENDGASCTPDGCS